MTEGIDVSKWQGTIHWNEVKQSGIQFAMIRASFGAQGVDEKFRENVLGASHMKICIGAYHYSYATTVNEAITEAEHFLNTIKGYCFEYPLALDMESQDQQNLDKKTLTDIALAFLETIRSHNYYPILYANKYWLENKLDMDRLKDFDIWLAQYRADSYTYQGKVGIWQYTSTGKVAGILSNVDRDISYQNYPVLIRQQGFNHLEEEKEMTLEQAKKIIQEKTNFDDNTMLYLEFYRYADSMIIRLAKAMT